MVTPVLDSALMHAVNWSELAQKLSQYGADAGRIARRLRALGVDVEPCTDHDALATAELCQETRSYRLSFAERAGLALADRLDLPVVMTDRIWASISDVTVAAHVIR